MAMASRSPGAIPALGLGFIKGLAQEADMARNGFEKSWLREAWSLGFINGLRQNCLGGHCNIRSGLALLKASPRRDICLGLGFAKGLD